ncbi:hypothetical protein [Sphingomonas gilva]|uniref:hypothetical protein n=1 Tax=Sphingomonas gilva TaxID=2305907 RepID=UPI0011C395B0|nr:hypothetical protein [Sphingomonas gilva]
MNEAVWRAKQWRHGRAAARVLATPPAAPRDDGVVLFSMIGTRVLLPYLVAAKSLHRHLGRGRFVVMDDGTLTQADRAALAHHLGDPRILALGDVDTGPAPRGGTWERLLAILDLRAADYVIQLDSDTVTLGPVPEVAAAIEAGRSFTLFGDARGAELGVLPAAEFVARHPAAADPRARAHVQARIEAAMADVAIPGLRYVRGCSGFAGFAPAKDGRRVAEAFTREAERLLGRAKWSEWGSEQVTSNVVIANDPDPAPLRYDRYTNFWNAPLGPDVAFAHFIGTYRHHGSAYLDATRAAIAALG